MNHEKISFYAHLTVTGLGVLLLGYLTVKYVFVLVLPFLIAWTVAFSVRPIANKISEGTKIPRRLVSVGLTAITFLGAISVIISLLVYAASEAWGFLSGIAESDALYEVLRKVLNPISGFLGDREGAEELESHIGNAINGMLSSLLSDTEFMSISLMLKIISKLYTHLNTALL